jgi:hypothetical protein
MMQLRPLGAGPTACQTELILGQFNHCLDLGAGGLEPPDRRSGSRQAVGSIGLGAVSEGQDCHAAGQPAGRCPGRMPSISPAHLAIGPAGLLQAADKVPATAMAPLQEGCGGISGIQEHLFGAAAQTMARRAQEFEGQLVLRGGPLTPPAYTRRDAQRASGPDPQHAGGAVELLATRLGPRSIIPDHGSQRRPSHHLGIS